MKLDKEKMAFDIMLALISSGQESELISSSIKLASQFSEAINNNRKDKPKQQEVLINEEDIEQIYRAYPSVCVVRGASTGKTSKNKEQIKLLLKEKSKQELILTIEKYVEDCKTNQVYMKNFSTFLNNLPDYSEIKLNKEHNITSNYQKLL